MQLAFRITARQWELLQRICEEHNLNMRAGFNKWVPEITPPEMIRMWIMTHAEDMNIIATMLNEPREALDLPNAEARKERGKFVSKRRR